MNIYAVGVDWKGEDQLPRFLSKGIWETGFEEQSKIDQVNVVKPGDLLFAKTSAKKSLDDGNKVSILRIRAYGKVTYNYKNGTVRVVWRPREETVDLETYYGSTIERVHKPDIKKQLTDLVSKEWGPKERLRSLKNHYKFYIKELGLENSLEKYKWGHINRFNGRPDLNANELRQELFEITRNTENQNINLIDHRPVNALLQLAELKTDRLKHEFKLLFKLDSSISEDLKGIKDRLESLYVEIKKRDDYTVNFDERTASYFLH